MPINIDGSKGIRQNTTEVTKIPVGTTAQRPANPEAGMMRFNTDEGYVEWYDDLGDKWLATSSFPGIIATGGTVTDIEQDGILYRVHTFTSSGTFNVARGGEVECLVVGGGAGARADTDVGQGGYGGGGAGGLVLVENNPISIGSYSITVGEGSASSRTPGYNDSGGRTTPNPNGDPSEAFGFIALGGGGGGADGGVGRSGGANGGGNGQNESGTPASGVQPSEPNIGASINAGNDGANSRNGNSGGGGGGASADGGNNTSDTTNGGDGIFISWADLAGLGENGYFAGGGAGGNNGGGGDCIGGLGGGGNGGSGAVNTNREGESGLPNTGGGGASQGENASGDVSTSGDGGSGIVIVRYRIG